MFFWTRPWTTQVLVALASSDKAMPTIPEWIFEVWMDSFLLLPLAIVVGQVHIRLSASIKLPKAVRASLPSAIWTLLLQCLFSDVFFRLLLWSVAGLVDLQEDTIIATTDGWKDHWGWNGPFILFTVRLVVAILGVAVGETFFPLVLTGGIACGKSTISKLLAEKAQFHMIDADKIGHQILLPPWHEQLNQPDALVTPNDSVYVRILETFANDADQAAAAATENNDSKLGTAVAGIHDKHPLLDDDKNIDRTKLGARIFATPAERQKLNAITHPKIFYCLIKNMAKSLYFGNDKPFVCAEVPLLFESGALRYIFGMVLVVACTETQQFNRLHKRNPELSVEECQKRIESQLPMTVKVQRADIVLWNDQDYSSLSSNNKKEEESDEKKKGAPQEEDETVKAQREAALSKQVDKAVRMVRQKTGGIMETTLSRLMLLLSASVVLSACFKLFTGNV